MREDDDNLFSGEPWAECEIDHLKALHGRVRLVEIGLDLKRSGSAVGSKAHELGLTRQKPRVQGHFVARRALTIYLRRRFKNVSV